MADENPKSHEDEKEGPQGSAQQASSMEDDDQEDEENWGRVKDEDYDPALDDCLDHELMS